MGKSEKALVTGAVTTAVGIAMYVVFGYVVEVQVPVIGLRQAGAVIAVLGIIEMVAARWGSKKQRDGRESSSGV